MVIEDKASIENHIKNNADGKLDYSTEAITGYAVNGAVHYGLHLLKNTSYKKIIAFGVSGDEKRHRITAIYIDNPAFKRTLPDVDSFVNFTAANISEYYTREVLGEQTDKELQTADILKKAAELHEDLRGYGSLRETEKPLVVSGILLALREGDVDNFSVDSLTGDAKATDGQKIYRAIIDCLKRTNIEPESKRDKILSQFAFIRDGVTLNEKNATLGKTPLRYFTEYLKKNIYRSIKATNSAEDYIGRFYGEFMSYSGGDGQTLGIILTPKHICELFCELVELKASDKVFDPCCGTGGFLIAAMHAMLKQTSDEDEQRQIRRERLHGIEIRGDMFTVATTNMILRGDGKSNLINADFFKSTAEQLGKNAFTVGMMNPPYSQGTKANPGLYELAFTEHLLDSLAEGARCAVIVPQSSMTGKSKEEQQIKSNIYKHHTLEGVITLNKDTFYGIGVMPCIAVFTAHRPHSAKHKSRFINFEDDGYKVSPHVGLVETESAKDRRAHLLDVWRGKMQAQTKFCVTTTVEPSDEWLHSFYYFNDTIPTEGDFVKTIGDYLTFEFSMVMQGREYLFEGNGENEKNGESDESEGNTSDTDDGTPPAAAPLGEGDGAPAPGAPPHHPQVSSRTAPLDAVKWGEFFIGSLFTVKRPQARSEKQYQAGKIPFVASGNFNNGVIRCCNPNENEILDEGNCITVSPVDGSAFYQPAPFLGRGGAGSSILMLYNKDINKYSGNFLAQIIRQTCAKYCYGKMGNQDSIKRERILLPTTPAGKPDYEFMEQYMRVHEASLIAGYRRYLGELESSPAAVPLDAVKWGEFNFTDVFVIRGGFYNKKPPHEENGTIPFLGAVDNNNGVTAFYTLDNIEANSKTGEGKNEPLDRKIFDGNCICVTNDGSVGHAYYQIAKFTCSHSVNPLYLKQYPLNRYLALFLIKAIEQQAASFMYSRKWRPSRMRSSKILLPTTAAGQPDYEFMESYAKHLVATQYRRYLDYLERTGR